MRQIFNPDQVGPSLSMPLDWGSTAMPLAAVAETGISVPVVPSELEWKCIRYVQHKSDDTFLQQREKTLKSALQKWRFMTLIDPACSDVGRQIMDMEEPEADLSHGSQKSQHSAEKSECADAVLPVGYSQRQFCLLAV